MSLPNRLPAAAHKAAAERWPQGRMVRIGRAWAVIGRVRKDCGAARGAEERSDETDKGAFCRFCRCTPGPWSCAELPQGWFAVLIAGWDETERDGVQTSRLWWTGDSWGHRRRRDALAAVTHEAGR